MKDRSEIVSGWLRKAESDLRVLDASLDVDALDAACFHAQQAAEKYLKAYLVHSGISFPYTHNLAKLVELCAGVDPAFHSLIAIAEPLTPYAVEMRYDAEFWPEDDVAREARALAIQVRDAVLSRLPNR